MGPDISVALVFRDMDAASIGSQNCGGTLPMLNILDVFLFVDARSVDLRRTCYRFLHRAAETMSGRISRVCFPGSGGGLGRPVSVVPNQPPIIRHIYDLSAGPVSKGCDFGGVQTPGLLVKLDSRGDPAGTRRDTDHLLVKLCSTNL